MVTLPAVIKIVLGIMVAVQVLSTVLPPNQVEWMRWTFGLVLFWNGEFLPDRVYSLVTYAFLHGGWLHLIFNALWIAILGSQICRILGTDRFLIFIFFTSIVGGLTQAFLHWGQPTLTIGASAVVFGLIGAAGHIWAAPLHLRAGERLRKLLAFSAIMMLLNVGYAYLGTPGDGGSAISWEAHAGGFFAGLLIFPLLVITRRPTLV